MTSEQPEHHGANHAPADAVPEASRGDCPHCGSRACLCEICVGRCAVATGAGVPGEVPELFGPLAEADATEIHTLLTDERGQPSRCLCGSGFTETSRTAEATITDYRCGDSDRFISRRVDCPTEAS